MARVTASTTTPAVRIVIVPNRSISFRGLLAFYGVMTATSASMAGAFALMGYWPVLPFAGLELLALGACLAVVYRRGGYAECIEIHDDTVSLFRRYAAHEEQVDLNRYWVRALIVAPDFPAQPGRLVLRSHGRDHELGRFLTEEERRSLCDRLARLIGPAGVVPAGQV